MLTPWVFSDEVGALNYALSIMQALYARERTGRGQHVETSQLGATVAFQYYGMAAALFDPEHRQRDDGKSPNDVGVVRIVAECSDGKWIVTLPNTEKQWRGFTDALERPELYEQAPDMAARIRTAETMKPEIHRELGTRTQAVRRKVAADSWPLALLLINEAELSNDLCGQEWVRRLNDADCPVSPVLSYADVASSEQLRANG